MKGLFLTDEPVSMKKYIFIMALIGLVPSLLISILITASGLFGQVGPDINPNMPVGAIVFSFSILSPILETLMMSLFFLILSLFIKSKPKLAVASAVLWALLHSLVSPPWGLIIVWPFYVFSCAYLTWRSKSWLKAIWVTACIHFLQNLLPSIAIMFAM